MTWEVRLHADFHDELLRLDAPIRIAIFASITVLESVGPQLGRPYADTLKGSKYPNMKELRVTVPDGEWRVAFAFDPRRTAILLVGGNKVGMSQTVFYRRLIVDADRRYGEHLAGLRKGLTE